MAASPNRLPDHEVGPVYQSGGTNLPRDDDLLRVHVQLRLWVHREVGPSGAGLDAAMHEVLAGGAKSQAGTVGLLSGPPGKTARVWKQALANDNGHPRRAKTGGSASQELLTHAKVQWREQHPVFWRKLSQIPST